MGRAPTLIVPSSTLTLRGDHQRKKSNKLLLAESENSLFLLPEPSASNMDEDMYDDDFDGGDDDGGMGSGKGRNKSRRELPTGAVETLKAWLLAPEHFTHPYPTPQDQAMLMQKTGIDKKQLKNWFTNARRRIWKPMLKKQIESGAIVNVNTNFNGLPVPGTNANPSASMDNPHSVQAVRVHYQQAMQDQNLQHHSTGNTTESYGNPAYISSQGDAAASNGGNYYGSEQQSGSVSTLGQLSTNGQLSKADSHAVLMELFARDQDLVRQATESARLKAESKMQQQHEGQLSTSGQQGQQQQQPNIVPSNQHPMMKAPSGILGVPSLNSWPHFSSITSLNNLGTLPGVKSITSLSGVDLSSKGNLNKMGNIAQVKSMESMGKNDSYAFLELFFGDRSSNNLSGMGGSLSNKGMLGTKQHGEEDNEIGLSLEDESPSHTTRKEFHAQSSLNQNTAFGSSISSNLGQTQEDTGYLKRAYDDALAARGLMSVSRSCENLSDLELPAKIQRTLSQEFLNKEQEQQVRQHVQQQKDQIYLQQQQNKFQSQQYPGQQATEPQGTDNERVVLGNNAMHDDLVQVSSSALCALCSQINIDTQLRPCGHMFHERCIKPSLSVTGEQPKCPIDDIPIHSAVLAVPENNNIGNRQQQTNDSMFSKPIKQE